MAFTHTTKEATEALRLSYNSLLKLRLNGVLQPGVHFRANSSGTKRPSLLWDVEAIDKALAERSTQLLTENNND